MCNKRIRINKYNDRANFMMSRLTFSLFIGLIFIFVSCSNKGPVYTNDIVVQEYPQLADAIAARDSTELMTFTDHSAPEVRSLSWRALAKATIQNPDSLLSSVIEKNEHAAWLALSYQELSDESRQRLREVFTGSPNQFAQTCEVFRRQGGEPELVRIIQHLPELYDDYLCSTAAGRILTREEISGETLSQLLALAFESESPVIRRNLLYGIYRNPLNRPENQDDLWNYLRESWRDMGIGNEPLTDQYMIGILGPDGANLFLDEMSTLKNISNQQLIIEFVRALDLTGDEVQSYQTVIMDLLSHSNPTIVTETLEKLKTRDSLDDALLHHIYQNHIQISRNPVIFVTAIELVQSNGMEIDPIMKKLEFIENQNPYLTNRILNIYRNAESEDLFLVRVQTYLGHGGIRALHAAQALTGYWIGLEDQSQTEQVRSLMRGAAEAGNRSVVSGLNTLLTDEALVRDGDFEWLQARYSESVSEKNSVNMNAFRQALETRFPDQDVEFTDPDEQAFKIPNWDRLKAIGTRPYWHLETEKGEIVIRLDPLSAPFTVSSVDSLTRAGAYDNVAFHRVVHNFVIQGGDVGRGDGFGGPEYTIPTEPSLSSFERGAVGIASSGTDTEGSQYFVMHQWAPHLDANYTLFGTVVRGMDTVDRIQMGDIVKKASISIH